ncbi:Oxygen-dependent choline dehydrogenase [Mycena sanguinolenta]|uniref:Oxygen-dependent choline dehydrogenase n=1 Tax=Mycena sanguinolenta TaxID=230812 RepID=A0A8H7DH04_9AGAR|nr:Oxygen-dependent choline dehydrogenase [Mycena sanguinolenta]
MFPFSSPYPTTPLNAASFEATAAPVYDFIIVGGGTAGCVLANRLSQNPTVKVLLLERGNARTGWATRVPLMSTNFMGDESAAYRWPASFPVGADRTLSLVTGKGLGGGSSINSMQYTRGSPKEYDLWSRNGRQGWSYAEVEPYFKKSEHFVNATVPARHHGTHGEWKVRDMGEFYFPTAKSCVEACTALGLPFTKDLNDPTTPLTVCAKLDCTIDAGGHRSSTFAAFLPQRLAEKRKSHLHICTGAAVTALDLEVDSNGQIHVQGVAFQANEPGSKVWHARAKKEVILCAGAISTPQILLLSGIGPEANVKKPLRKELAGVGQNLQDHVAMGIMYSVPTDQSLHIIQSSGLRAVAELLRYIAFGEGLFLSPVTQLSILVDSALIDNEGRVHPQDPTKSASLPDLELMPIHFNYSDPPIHIEDGVFSLKVGLMRPRSRGTVTLASTDPLQRPACELGFLSNPADLEVMRRGIRLAKRIGEKMRELGAPLKDFYMPESEADADLDIFIRRTVRTTYHYGCTCRMAPERDAGVVDDELKLHGIAKLRIADCSIIPEMMSTHLQAPVVMIAEKCADMIMREHLGA